MKKVIFRKKRGNIDKMFADKIVTTIEERDRLVDMSVMKTGAARVMLTDKNTGDEKMFDLWFMKLNDDGWFYIKPDSIYEVFARYEQYPTTDADGNPTDPYDDISVEEIPVTFCEFMDNVHAYLNDGMLSFEFTF